MEADADDQRPAGGAGHRQRHHPLEDVQRQPRDPLGRVARHGPFGCPTTTSTTSTTSTTTTTTTTTIQQRAGANDMRVSYDQSESRKQWPARESEESGSSEKKHNTKKKQKSQAKAAKAKARPSNKNGPNGVNRQVQRRRGQTEAPREKERKNKEWKQEESLRSEVKVAGTRRGRRLGAVEQRPVDGRVDADGHVGVADGAQLEGAAVASAGRVQHREDVVQQVHHLRRVPGASARPNPNRNPNRASPRWASTRTTFA